jgi:HPt (histidine-containing phosphotransfer) domain-containing protein
MSFKLLKNPKNNILETLSVDDWNAFRKIFISCILSTDMTHHFEILTKLQTRLKTGPLGSDSKDHQQLANIILKCSDISNVCRPHNVSKMWAEALVQEFLNQGDAEKERNLPVSPLMDRATMNKAKLQVNFIDYIAGPLFKTVTSYLSGMDEVNGYIQKNRDVWSEVLQKQKEEKLEVKYDSWIVGDIDKVLFARIKGFNAIVLTHDSFGGNQISHVLQTRGYSTSIAHDIDTCLSYLERDNDIIVIEVLGKESFESIKKITESNHRKIPIIGLSKSNDFKMTEDIFHDFFTVPVDVSAFIISVEKGVTISQNYADCFDLKVAIDQSGDDIEFLQELIEIFDEECSKQIVLIESAITSKNSEEIENIAHSMKGAAAQIAAKPLCRAAYLLEQSAKERNVSEYSSSLELIKKRFDDFKLNSKSILQKNSK